MRKDCDMRKVFRWVYMKNIILLLGFVALFGCDQKSLDVALKHNNELREKFMQTDKGALIDAILGGDVGVVCIFLPNSKIRNLPFKIENGIKEVNVWKPIWDESWTLVYEKNGKYDYIAFDQLAGHLRINVDEYRGLDTPCFNRPIYFKLTPENVSGKNFIIISFY